MGFKRVLVALAKAACYAALFILLQLFASFAVAFVLAIGAGVQAAQGGMPDILALTQQVLDKLLENTMLITFISNGATILILYPIFALQKKRYSEEICLRPIKSKAVWPLAIGALSLAMVVGMLLAALPIPEEVLEGYAEASENIGGMGLLEAISSVFMAPIAEEIIFRGLVYTRLRRAMPPWLACVLASAIFGLLHGQIVWIAYAFVVGMALALVFERTGTLWASIILHVTFNLAGGYILPYVTSGMVFILAPIGLVISWLWLKGLYPRGGNTPEAQ